MNIDIDMRPREGGADVILTTDEADPMWALLRHDAADGRLSGYWATPGAAGLATLRPIAFRHAGMTEDDIGKFALYAFVTSAGMDVSKRDSDNGARSATATVSAWEAFLGDARAPVGDDGTNRSAHLDKETRVFLVSLNLARWTPGKLVMNRNPGLRGGAAASGFDAVRVQKAVSTIQPRVTAPPEIDIDAARAALKAVGRPSSGAVVWYGTTDAEKRTIRGQAAAAFPLLAGVVADNPTMARAVDARESLAPLVSERTGFGKSALKRLAKIARPLPAGRLIEHGERFDGEDQIGVNRVRRTIISGDVSLDMALKHLSDMPPDRIPQNDDAWMAYHDILSGCAIPIENALGIPVAQTLSSCKGDWTEYHAILARAADYEPESFDRRTIALATSDAIEAMDEMNRAVVLPLTLAAVEAENQAIPEVDDSQFQSGMDAVGRIMTGEAKNIAAALYEKTRRYISRINAMQTLIEGGPEAGPTQTIEERMSAYDAESFPVLCDDYQASNGLVVRPLRNLADMREESDRMDHCVGGSVYGPYYLKKLRDTSCHIFTVRSADDARSCSTIEIFRVGDEDIKAGRFQVGFRQHQGVTRRDPGNPHAGRTLEAVAPEAQAAATEWSRKLAEGAIRINTEEMISWRSLMEEIVEARPATGSGANRSITWKSTLGIDWRDADLRQGLWEEWRNIVGGSWGRGETPDILWRDKGVRALLSGMSPVTAGILEERAREARAEARIEAVPEPDEEGPAP